MGRSGTSAYAIYALSSHFCYVGGFGDLGDPVVPSLRGVSGDILTVYVYQDTKGCLLPDIYVSPIQLDEAGTKVLGFSLKPKNRKTNKMVQLVVSSGIQLCDSLNLSEIMVPALVDSGAQIEVLAGEELFPSGTD